jgi:mannosyltransferase
MKPSRYLTLSVLAFILLLATWLRFYRIEYQSYWNDEGNSRVMAGKSVGGILQSAAADIHPPGYYLALKLWRGLVGETEFGLRSFSALTGLVLVALLFRLGREYLDPPAAVAAALLGAINPFLIYYSQEARMYALLATLSAASFLLFSKWLKSSRPPASPWGDGRLGIGYCLTTAFGLYTHYAFPFVLLAQNLAALGGLLAHRRRSSLDGRGAWRKRFAVWVGWQAITLALFLPWLPAAYRQLITWPATRESHPFLAALADMTRFLAFGRTIKTEEVIFGLIMVGILLLLGLRRGGQTITPLLWLVVPAGLTLAFGLLTDAFSKFLLVAVPPMCLLLGNGLAGWGMAAMRGTPVEARGPRRLIASWALNATIWILGLGVIYSTYLSLNNLYFNPAYFRDDYRGIARYVEQLARPGDAIITLAPNQIEAFGYYHRSGAEVFPLPHTRPLDEAETSTALADITANHSRLFVLYWGDEQADPRHFVEDWLNTNTFKAGEEWYGQVRLATYAVAEPAAAIATRSGARFTTPSGATITLEGFTLASSTLAHGDTMSPGDIVQLTLFWKTDAALKERYKVFVHVFAAPDQPPPAQQDGEPVGGRAPTDTWQPGQQVADNHGVLLPDDLPAGTYTLAVGLYNLFDGTRLPITLNGAGVGDRLELGTITVK